MNIMNINHGSFNTSKHLFNQYTNNHNINVACISETFEYQDKTPTINGWQTFSKPRAPDPNTNVNPHGGVAIIARQNVKIREAPKNLNLPNIEIIACETFFDHTKFLVICVYILDYNSLIQLCQWINHIDKNDHPNILICGDFNSHHTNWDTTYYTKYNTQGDKKGKHLAETIA